MLVQTATEVYKQTNKSTYTNTDMLTLNILIHIQLPFTTKW